MKEAAAAIRKQNEFVAIYSKQYFNDNQEQLRSNALKEYYSMLGYDFGLDGDNFIVPDFRRTNERSE